MVDAEMGSSDGAPRVMTFAMEEMEDEPLTAVPHFPTVLFLFCLFRLVKPLLLRGQFADSDLWQDGGAVFADACEFAGVVGGLISAILLGAPFRYLLVHLPTPAKVIQLHEPLALGLLAASALVDVLHFLVALIRYRYFWTPAISDGVVDPGSEWTVYLLIGLHLAGLLGTIWLIGRFVGRFLSAMSQANARSLTEVQKIKAEKRYVVWHREADDSSTPRPRGQSARKVPVDFGGPMGSMESDLRMSASGRSADSSDSESSSPGTVWMPGSQVEPPDEPLAAWFWAADQYSGRWLRVTVIRTMGEDMASVRMGGGVVVPVKVAGLRPRFPGSSPPEDSHGGRPVRKPKQAWASFASASKSKESNAAGSEADHPPRPSSADRQPWQHGAPSSQAGDGSPADSPPREHANRRARRKSGMDGAGSADGAGTASSSAGAKPPRPPSPEPQQPPAAPEPEDDSEGARWAASRMVLLRKELIELDQCTLEERKKRLRNLQRELHPDKQQEDLRSYAQPLFLLVQREWELLAAAQSGNADQ